MSGGVGLPEVRLAAKAALACLPPVTVIEWALEEKPQSEAKPLSEKSQSARQIWALGQLDQLDPDVLEVHVVEICEKLERADKGSREQIFPAMSLLQRHVPHATLVAWLDDSERGREDLREWALTAVNKLLSSELPNETLDALATEVGTRLQDGTRELGETLDAAAKRAAEAIADAANRRESSRAALLAAAAAAESATERQAQNAEVGEAEPAAERQAENAEEGGAEPAAEAAAATKEASAAKLATAKAAFAETEAEHNAAKTEAADVAEATGAILRGQSALLQVLTRLEKTLSLRADAKGPSPPQPRFARLVSNKLALTRQLMIKDGSGGELWTVLHLLSEVPQDKMR